ncbi:MAG: site-specific DNA-methyltransferase [Methylocella sp.]
MSIIRADARNISLRDGCVQTVVTSPPYFGLRDYGIVGQIGLERTLDEYLGTMVQVFRELWRVCRDDATVWLNLGDSYASGTGGDRNVAGDGRDDPGKARARGPVAGLKPKDLCGIPWRVAFALQADGWYLRSDIIWAKPNPMPESVTDRPTRAHEYIFLLSKSERYYYDADAIREPSTSDSMRDGFRGSDSYTQGRSFNNSAERIIGGGSIENRSERNKRSVWAVNSEPTPEAHFATFPQKLIEPCILAGTSEKGRCAQCGAPRVREVVDSPEYLAQKANHPGAMRSSDMESYGLTRGTGRTNPGLTPSRITTGWRPSCSHDAPSVPCLVLDPFLGSGTVGKVAERFGRRWVGLELSAAYIQIAEKRTAQMGMQFGSRA